MIIYIYKKTHKKTGLQYLGKTVQNPFVYQGSGIRWLNHLNVHGNDVNTEILKECVNNDEVKTWGLYYSNLWNIVESNDWANLREETGDGGDTSHTENYINKKDRFSLKGKDNPRFKHGRETVELRKERSLNGPGRGRWGPRSYENRNYNFEGDKNPNSKKVMTPNGIFNTVKSAAEGNGLSLRQLYSRFKKFPNDFYRLTD